MAMKKIVVGGRTRKKKMTIWVMIKKMKARKKKMIEFKDFLNLLLLVEAQQSMFSSYCNIFYVVVVKNAKAMMRKRKPRKSRPSKRHSLFNQPAAR